MANLRVCSVEGCGKPHAARGFCKDHYYSWRRKGGPLLSEVRAKAGDPLRFAALAVEHTSDNCLLWPYSVMGGGYGHLLVGGRYLPAHRYVCMLAHGEPSDPFMQAAHSCGVACCVNPKHLRWATSIENSADKIDHGTLVVGEAHPETFLSEREVVAIRRLTELGVVQRQIAHAFNVSPQRVNEIVRGKAWKHAAGPTH